MLKYKNAIIYITAILGLFIYLLTLTIPQIGVIFNLEKNINEKNVEIQDLNKKLAILQANENAKRINATQIKKIYKSEGFNVDAESSFALILDDIINMTQYNGVRVFAIKYTYNPMDDDFASRGGGKYNVCQLDMDLVTDYQNFESFLKEVLKYPYLINISKIELIPYQKNKKIILIKLQLNLYSEK